jgi:DDE superfamily endonuclease
MTTDYIARMENLLRLYALPYDARYPVICFDERPCFLIGNLVEGLALQPGQVAKDHYAYTKHGSCVVLAATEPLTGQRLMRVYSQRTQKEYTAFMQELAALYPDAVKIQLVQDNLNTHKPNSFYSQLSAGESLALSQRFDWHYTPKSASWLNMIELEFSALARQCLNRRIPSQTQLETEVLSWAAERNQQAIKINWQFTVGQARETLNNKYMKINSLNNEYRKT